MFLILALIRTIITILFFLIYKITYKIRTKYSRFLMTDNLPMFRKSKKQPFFYKF